MDFKDILTQFDKVTEKENKSLVEKETKRPSNMLTESKDDTVEVIDGVKVPSLSKMFEELSLEPAQPGAQVIQKDGQAIGSVSNPAVANSMKQAMDKGELTIGEEEISEAEDWIKGAVKKPGAFKAKAKRAGMSTAEFARHVLSHKDDYPSKTEKQANLAQTFAKMDEATIQEAKDWIDGAIKNPGAFTKKAKSHGMTTKAFAKKVLANKDDFPAKTEKQANLAQTLGKMKEAEQPPQGPGQASPLTFEEGANMSAQYPADDGSHNSSNDEKGNAAANAALAANDSDTPQLVKEKDYDVKPTKNPKPVKGKVLNPKGKTDGKASPETYVESKSRKLPTISRVKAMCNEGLSTSDIKQLHPKCNQKELNIMIKNTKTNLKEGADHILKAAKHMGHAHGLCKGSYACPHDEGSEGHKAYHEGYKAGLDECMGIRNEPIIGMDEAEMDEGIAGGIAGAYLGGKTAGIPGALAGGVLGHQATKEGEGEIVDTMASYGAMDEAESSPDGNVGADDDGAYDKYDWDAQTVARKGIDEDDFEEGNAFTAKLGKGDSFKMGNKTYKDTSSLEEDEWTFESFDKELQTHLNEGKESTKTQLDEGYTMSITQGEQNQPDRVSVNATDAEADKLIKFVKDVGLGNYGDAEVLDAPGEVADVSFYGSPEQSEEPGNSHDDMLKLMGIVDLDGDYEDEVEAPGTVDIDVEECGSDNPMEEGHQGYNDKEDESLGMRDGKSSSKDDDYAGRRDQSRGDWGHRDGGKVHEEQGYDDKEDESLGMRTGKESDKEQSMKDRRDDSYGKWGKRDEEHREISKEGQGYDDKEDESLGMRTGKESDKKQSMKDRRDDSYGKFGKRDHEHRDVSLEEKQGYDDEEDESLGMRTGKESGKKQSMKDRRDDSYGKFGKRDKEDRHVSLEEKQGYDDEEDESLGMRTGKESGKKQSMKDRRDDSYGKFGKRDSEHRDVSLEEQEKDAGLYDKYDWDASTVAKKGIDEESDAERDDHAERAGKEVARHAKYDDRRHPGRDGEDIVKDLEYDDWKDRHHMDEDQGYDDKEDESLGMRTGKESDKKQSMKDRRDDSYGKFGKRDKEDRHVSLEENLRTLDLLAEVGAETSEEPTQPLSQHDDERLLTKEGAEDAPKDSVNDGENEEITEVQTDDQREFTVAEDEKEEKLDEWANDAGKNGTDTSFEQDIDFMTKVISGGVNKQKSTGQTTIPVIAGQEDRMGYNGADVVKEGSVLSSSGFATILNKLDSIK